MRSIWRYGQVMSGLLPAFGLGMAVLAGSAQAQTAPIRVQDDRGRAVVLAEPARRAVTLAPHATELVYAAGAGDRIAATIRGSDYPPAARAAGHRRWHATGRGTRGRRPARPDHRLATGRRRTAGPRHGQAGRAGTTATRRHWRTSPPRWNGWASCSAPRTRLGPPPGAARTAGPAGRAPCRPPAAAGLHPGRAGSHLHAESDQHRQRRPALVRRRQRLRRLARGGAPGVAGKRAGGPARRRAGGRVAAGRQGEQPRGLAQACRPPRPAMCTASTPMPCTVPAPA